MLTITLDEPGTFSAATTEEPTRKPGEALVRLHRLGVCGTDLHAFTGKQPFFDYPRILGHELGVEVLEIDDDAANNPRAVAVGDRCCIAPLLTCAHAGKPLCVACRRGKTNCCEHIAVLGVHTDGGMRERFVVPAANLYASETLSYDQLALVETLCIGGHAVDRAEIEKDEFALVIGAGPIGLTAVQFLQAAGAKVAVMDLSDERLGFCRDAAGVKHLVNPGKGDATEQLRGLKSDGASGPNGGCGDLPTAIFDATGHPGSMMGTFDLIAPGGRIVFIGLFPGEVTFNDPNFHKRECTLLASRNSKPSNFEKTIAMIEAGQIDTTPWITHRLPLAGVPDQFAGLAKQPGLIKAMIEA